MATLQALAELVGGKVHQQGSEQAGQDFTAIMPLEWADAASVSFFANAKYLEAAQRSAAGAIIAREPFANPPCPLILHHDPYLAAAKLANHFHPRQKRQPMIHPSAVIAPTARVGRAFVGPCCVIDDGAEVSDGAELVAQVYVGRAASVGKDAVLQPGVKLMDGCQVGERALLHAGVVIGADGFGFAEDASAADGKRRIKIPQIGIVMIGDDVEIGANTTIDRATFGVTDIGAGSKIDDQVMIGHNVVLGTDCVLVAQSGIAGSTKLGKRVIVGGQAGFAGHLKIGDGAQIGAQSGVQADVGENQAVLGAPARPAREQMRLFAALNRLPELHRRVFRIGTKNQTASSEGRKHE